MTDNVSSVSAAGLAAPEERRAQPALLEAVNLEKQFGGVHAVNKVSLTLNAGEFVVLLGDNGAGKSTLIKMLAGAYVPDAGHITMLGERLSLNSPAAARAVGIETVWQDLALARDMDLASNMYLGRELTRGFLPRLVAPLRTREMQLDAVEKLRDLGINASAFGRTPIEKFSGGQIQAIAVARAASWATKILILDEATAALGVRQTSILLDLCTRLRDRGLCVVLITHSIPGVVGIADRFVVLRHGKKVGELGGSVATAESLVAHIVGAAYNGEAVS